MTVYARTLPEQEQQNRINGLQQRLIRAKIHGALILQKADLFYYSGTTQQGWLYIPAEGQALFMVFKDYDRAKAESGLDQVAPLLSPKEIPAVLSDFGCSIPRNLGLEMDVISANHYLQFQNIFSGSKLMDISLEIRLQRAVKSDHEIRLMRASSQAADRVAAKVPELLRAGLPEIELAGLLEAYARSLGHQGLIRMRMWDNDLFYGHIMAGAGAAVPSSFASPTGGLGINPSIAQGPGMNPIKAQEPVLVDYVFVLNGYTSDHTRIFSIGRVPDVFLKAHDAMLEIQDLVRRKAVPGAVTGDLYDMMTAMADARGYSDFFMGAGQRRIRFAGHGIGLELDEFPFIAQGQTMKLEKGMIIALEPKVVMPGKGVVGIENTLLVTENGLESLTTFPDEIAVIEPSPID